MEVRAQSKGLASPRKATTLSRKPQKAAVLRELKNILYSHPFRASERSRQFLSYVVKQTLQGQAELLKERSIGVELFHRPASYSTGEDGVVRVQAGEVRRRLEQYYHEQADSALVRVELPVGSYIPEIRWNRDATPMNRETPYRPKNHRKLRLATVTGRALDQFWSPVFVTPQPVLICVANRIVYRPSPRLFRGYSKTHPTEFQTGVDRYNKRLPLDPHDMVAWGDMVELRTFGVAMGDAYVAARLSALFARINKPSQVRIGNNCSFVDLRNSPAVLVGAFNNRWTLEMTSSLRFVFREEAGRLWIEDRGSPGRVLSSRLWSEAEVAEDYGIVTRLLSSKTGQVLIAAAGIGEEGTQAAGEFISTPDYLRECFRTAPPDWPKKNLQVVVHTTVTESVAGPPRVAATYFW